MCTWMWLLAAKSFLVKYYKLTTTLGNLVSTLELIGTIVFFVLIPFRAPHWWYLLIAIGVYAIVFILSPFKRPNPYDQSPELTDMKDAIGSHLSPIILVLMYLYLFNVL